MCATRRFCGLLITLLFNLPIVSLVLGLDSGTWELKLFALPFAASPVAAIALYACHAVRVCGVSR